MSELINPTIKESLTVRLNPNEAPLGYYAVKKSDLDQSKGNICRQCDWREQCQNDKISKLSYGHRCMDYPVIAANGKKYQREDKKSVVFKKSLEVK